MARFEKYEGLGNDFLLFDGTTRHSQLDPGWVRQVCDRHRGVGADGVIGAGRDPEGVYFWVYNADGSRPEMCGNGVRCAVLALARRGVLEGALAIATDAGEHGVQLNTLAKDQSAAEVTVRMRTPDLKTTSLPFVDERPDPSGPFLDQPLEFDGRSLRMSAVSMGNPHIVTFDAVGIDRMALGPRIEGDRRFPKRVNVEFAALLEDAIELHVYERGAGFTQACGTGACAVGVAACATGRREFGSEMRIDLPGGPLFITVPSLAEPVLMRGAARFVFEGSFQDPF